MTEAERAQRISRLWWAQVPLAVVIAAVPWPWVQRIGLGYLAACTIISNAATYGGKAKAAEAKEANT